MPIGRIEFPTQSWYWAFKKVDLIKQILAGHAAEITNLGVKSLAVFGSVSRGEARDGSDADFLVEFERPGFDAYMGLKFLFEELLAMPVDLVTENALRPELRNSIKRDAQLVA